MNALVLGATGATGRRVAAELARSDELTSLTLVARDSERVEEVADLLGGSQRSVSPLVLDLNDSAGLAGAFEGADIVVSCCGPTYVFEARFVAAAVAARVPYVSLFDDHMVLDQVASHGPAAEQAGATIVTGCGLSPGLTNFMAVLGARQLDEVTEIDVAVAASSADSEGPAATLHLLALMTSDAPFVSDHQPSVAKAGTAPRLVYFPEPVGWVETFRIGHPEVVTLADRFSGLRSLAFRLGLTEKVTMDVLRASVATGLLKSEKSRQTFSVLTGPMRPALEKIPPRGAPWTSARVDVRGRSEGKPADITLGITDHLSNLACIPLAVAAVELASKRVVRPGVHAPDEVFEPSDFFKKIGERGLRIARLEPYPV